jgi:selenium metabolism protein YedF
VEASAVEGGFLLTIEPGAAPSEEPLPEVSRGCATGAARVIFISDDEIGGGERELGAALMKTFIYTAAESDDPPDGMVFMNSGVRLVTENEETVEHLRRLADRGVDILVCGTCLDYYGLKERLKVGRVSNMYEIQSVLIGAGNLVSL